jgi:hypothetical protein
MRDLVLRLEAERCADKVERVRLDEPPAARTRYGKAGPIWFFWRSDRHERVVQEAVDLENPLVVRFVNADDDQKRIKFLSTFGLPEGFLLVVPDGTEKLVARFLSLSALPEEFLLGAPDVGLPAEPRDFVLGAQRELRRLLEDAGSGDAARTKKAESRSLRLVSGDGDLSRLPSGRMALTVRTLIAFMRLEIAMVVENGARIASCKRCGDLFLYGKGTKRRSTATYCRDLCRVGAYRSKLNQKGD